MFFQKPIARFIFDTILFLFMIILASTCKEVEDESSKSRTIPVTKFIGQNIIPIDGPEFGSGIKANRDLYKQVRIVFNDPKHVDLSVSKAFIQKLGVSDIIRFSYIVPVDNISTNHAYCGVKSTGLTFLNSEYSKIYTDVLDSKAYSSIGLSNSTKWDHCIKPGGTGYIVGTVETIALDPYDKIEFVELGISYTSDSVVNSGAKVEAYSYDVSGDWIDVSVKNNGYDTAYIWPYTSIVLVLDSDGSPMQWDYLNVNLSMPTKIDPTIDSTGDLPILKSKIGFGGVSSKAIFLLTFKTSPILPF